MIKGYVVYSSKYSTYFVSKDKPSTLQLREAQVFTEVTDAFEELLGDEIVLIVHCRLQALTTNGKVTIDD